MPGYPGGAHIKPSESLADHIRDLANAFASAAGVLSQHYTDLNKATSGLLDGTYPWQGQGATSFSNTWQMFGQYMQQLQKACEDTHISLVKYANKLDDVEAQQAWNMLLMVAGGILTIVSFAAAISELGLNPFVDGFTGVVGTFTEQEGSNVVNVAEDITQADTEAVADLQAIEDDLTTVPTLNGNVSGDAEGVPDAIAPVNLNDMTNLSDLTDDDSALFAKGNSNSFKNPINMSMDSTEANMPPGVNNNIGKNWIQQIKNLGVRVEWNRSAQAELEGKGLGFTDNRNVDPENADTAFVVVGLSPDTTNATVYEEFLHVQEAQARGWMPPSDPPVGRLTEEIQVEYQVLQKAEDLSMPNSEFDTISQIRQSYITQLKDVYEERGLSWPPADLVPYLQDPLKPGN